MKESNKVLKDLIRIWITACFARASSGSKDSGDRGDRKKKEDVTS